MRSGSLSSAVIGCDRNRIADGNGAMKETDKRWTSVMFSVKTTFGYIFQNANYHIT